MANYPQYNWNYPQYQYQQPQQSNQGLLWVQGETGARAYMVSPGQTVLLMDSEGSSFYLKSADQAGMPLPLRVFDYKERATAAPQAAQPAPVDMDSKYVTRQEYDALKAACERLEETLKGLKDE